MKKQTNPRMIRVADKKQQAEALLRMRNRDNVIDMEVPASPVKK